MASASCPRKEFCGRGGVGDRNVRRDTGQNSGIGVTLSASIARCET